MQSIVLKHNMLPIPDLVIDYEIHHKSRQISAKIIGANIDSSLLTEFFRGIDTDK